MSVYRNYLKRERTSVLLYSILLFGSAYLLAVVFPSIQKIKALKDYLEQLPPFMRAFFGAEALEFTRLEGFLTVEYFNTTWVFIVGVFTSLFAGSLVAEETEKKTLEIVLSAPLDRRRFVVEKFLGFVVCLTVVNACSWLGIVAGAVQIGERPDYRLYLLVHVAGTICMIAIGAVALFVSCAASEQRRATGLAMAFFLALYFFNIVAVLLEQYPILARLSLFHYFDASRIVKNGAISWNDLSVPFIVAAAFFTASLIRFQRKDIYV